MSGSKPPFTGGYDLPNSQGQFHIHGDCAHGRIYDYSRQNYVNLNAYETAMADLYAKNIGLKPIDPNNK